MCEPQTERKFLMTLFTADDSNDNLMKCEFGRSIDNEGPSNHTGIESLAREA